MGTRLGYKVLIFNTTSNFKYTLIHYILEVGQLPKFPNILNKLIYPVLWEPVSYSFQYDFYCLNISIHYISGVDQLPKFPNILNKDISHVLCELESSNFQYVLLIF